jgi:peptide/nickel transport system substrate-binding protein
LWHDGRPVTAADVKFTFEEVLLKYHGRTRAALGKNLQAVESPDAHTMERNAWIDDVYKGWDFDLAFTHFENGADPDIGVKRVYVSSNIVPVPFSNAAGYQNPHVDQLFDRGARELDRVARTQAYFEIQDILVRDSPYLWLVEAGRLWGVAFRSEFRGLHSWSSKSIMTYGDDAWWSKGKLGRE